MSNLKQPDHSIFNHPGDEGSAPSGTEAQAEERNNSVPTPSHAVVQSPGSEGSSGLSQNDEGYQQGYVCDAVAQKVPGYVGLGGPDPMKTRVVPTTGADPTPGMPGAK
jgi:hypothetical protein